MIDFKDLRNDAAILIECAERLVRPAHPVMLHPGEVVKMCDDVLELIAAAELILKEEHDPEGAQPWWMRRARLLDALISIKGKHHGTERIR